MKKAGLFLPVFLQEMDFLGQKVFGNRQLRYVGSGGPADCRCCRKECVTDYWHGELQKGE
jgi:hypothetical protein